MMTNEFDFIQIIKEECKTKMNTLNWSSYEVAFFLDGLIYGLSDEYSNQFFNELYDLRNEYIEKGNNKNE
ncbi:MAG: hypothetical protein ACI31M_04465 [Bacilli bacterium]